MSTSPFSELAGSALAYQPSLCIVPDVSRPGDVLTLTATGFKPFETVFWFLDDAEWQFASCDADEEGSAAVSYSIPDGFTGAHRFKAVGESSEAVIIKTYEIGDYTPTITVPASANAGDTVPVSVGNFGWIDSSESKYISIYINGAKQSSDIYIYNNTSEGVAACGSGSYRIPYNLSGIVEIRAEISDDPDESYMAIASVQVTAASASLSVAPEGQHGGQSVTLTASGFAPDEYIYFYTAGSYKTAKYADSSGTAVVTLTLASEDVGSILFEAEGYISGLKRTALYQAVPAVMTLTGPQSLYAGSAGSFTVTGIGQNEYVGFYVNGQDRGQNYGYAGQALTKNLTLSEVGNALITVVGMTTGNTASYVCEIKNRRLKSCTHNLTDAYEAGSEVTMNATGFKANEQIKFYVNTVLVSTAR